MFGIAVTCLFCFVLLLIGGSRSIGQPTHQRVGKTNNTNINSYNRVSATPPPVNKLLTAGGIAGSYQKAPRIGPGGRRMVKSFSQDAASSMASAATIAMNTLNSGSISGQKYKFNVVWEYFKCNLRSYEVGI